MLTPIAPNGYQTRTPLIDDDPNVTQILRQIGVQTIADLLANNAATSAIPLIFLSSMITREDMASAPRRAVVR